MMAAFIFAPSDGRLSSVFRSRAVERLEQASMRADCFEAGREVEVRNERWKEMKAVAAKQAHTLGARARRPAIWMAALLAVLGLIVPLFGQSGHARMKLPGEAGDAALQARAPAPGRSLTIDLQQALERARKNDPGYRAALTQAHLSEQDTVQARAALLPSLNSTNQLMLTQGNGTLPTGRFVSNNGVHLYRVWGVVHEDLSASTLTLDGYRAAQAAAAVDRARAEVARRGLAVTVTSDYYELLAAEHKLADAQKSLQQARKFLATARQLEQGGEVAHSDVVKFQLQENEQQQKVRDAGLSASTVRLDLAVLLFADFNQDFQLVDDLDQPPPLPPYADIRSRAEKDNPRIRMAIQSLRQANKEASLARFAFLPQLSLNLDYGIEANALALRSRVAAEPGVGRLPNLGFFLTATVSFPIWNWGALHSRLRQARYRREQAHLELTFSQRKLLHDLESYYQAARTARAQVDGLRDAMKLALESLRLNRLRYGAGEATVLELVDAQNTLTLAQSAYAEGQLRYRVALSRLQTLTGDF